MMAHFQNVTSSSTANFSILTTMILTFVDNIARMPTTAMANAMSSPPVDELVRQLPIVHGVRERGHVPAIEVQIEDPNYGCRGAFSFEVLSSEKDIVELAETEAVALVSVLPWGQIVWTHVPYVVNWH